MPPWRRYARRSGKPVLSIRRRRRRDSIIIISSMKNYRGVRKWLNAVLVLGVAGMLTLPAVRRSTIRWGYELVPGNQQMEMRLHSIRKRLRSPDVHERLRQVVQSLLRLFRYDQERHLRHTQGRVHDPVFVGVDLRPQELVRLPADLRFAATAPERLPRMRATRSSRSASASTGFSTTTI